MPRALFTPTPDQRRLVRIATACGMPQPLIAAEIINPEDGKPISEKLLRARFREELNDGKVTALAMVAQSLFRRALGDSAQATTAAIFILKTQAGWKEPEVAGGPLMDQRSIAEALRRMAAEAEAETNSAPTDAA